MGEIRSLYYGMDELRKKILKVSYLSGACHIGSSLSCVEILQAIKGKNPFIFSKASGVCTWYCMNYSEEKCIELMKKHPLPSKEGGLIWSGGSLGMGLSVACGIALTGQKTYILLSDGEMQEGQTWEAAMFGATHKLPVIAIIDRNKCQALGMTEDIVKLDPLEDKLRAFGWNTQVVDGHNIDELKEAIKGRTPLIVIAKTIKGCGVDFLEKMGHKNHYYNLSESDYKIAINSLTSK